MRRQRGRVIVVVGPDGTGKTSLADGLVASVLASQRVLRAHQRVPLLPRRTRHQGPVLEPHGQPPYSRWLSAVKLGYLYIDELLGWFIRVRPFVAGGGWVVLERGWWDLAVDPRRYRLQSTERLARWLGHHTPRPDLTLILAGSGQSVRSRRRELPAEEIDRQVRAWTSVLPAAWPRATIDVDAPADVVLARAAAAVREYLQEGARSRPDDMPAQGAQ